MILYKFDDYRYLEFQGTLPNKIMVMNVLELIEKSEKHDKIKLAFINECILMSKEALGKYNKVEYEDTDIEYHLDFNNVFEKRKNENKIKYTLSINKPMGV